MTDPAGRPAEGGRPPESASFAPSRLGVSRRARPSVLGAAFIIVLALIVAAGLGGRLGAGAFPLGAENQAPASPSAFASAAPATAPASPPVPPTPRGDLAFPADTGPVYTSAPGAMAVQAKRHPQTVFVHGDIDAPRITWVFVSVLDDVGRVAGWTSVSVPGGAGANASGGPALRFDVELAIPADFQGRLWVRAQAYDTSGKVIATANVEIPTPGS